MREDEDRSIFDDPHYRLVLGALIVFLAPWLLYELLMWLKD